jgi:uncharacterized YigZ family protein
MGHAAHYTAGMSEKFTLLGAARLQQDIRKSRFLAQAAKVETAEAALAFIARVGVPDATHNCWAWRIGAQYRFSDDGEPGGSAGRPILLAIEGQAVDCVAVVVTRWYGGIKLGVGGLARAYGGCAAECLRLADKELLVERVRVHLRCDFAAAPMLYARLRDFDAVRYAENASSDGVELALDVPAARVAALAIFVRDLTRGRGSVEIPT